MLVTTSTAALRTHSSANIELSLSMKCPTKQQQNHLPDADGVALMKGGLAVAYCTPSSDLFKQ